MRAGLRTILVFGIAVSTLCSITRGAAPIAPIPVIVRTVEQDGLQGSLSALSLTEGALLRTNPFEEKRIATRDLVRVTSLAPSMPRPAGTMTVTLTNGDVLHGELTDARDDALVIETLDLGILALPLDAIARMSTAKVTQPAYRKSAVWLDEEGTPGDDRVLLVNGDLVRGFISSIGSGGVAIDTEMGAVSVPLRLVVAARLASPPSPPPHDLYMVLTLRTGGRITLTSAEWVQNVIQASPIHGTHFTLEAERVARVDVFGGRWEWLSAHRPISFEHTPMLALAWGYEPNRNVVRGPLEVAGKTYQHGVGVHSRSVLTYDLRGAYSEFVTAFGLDDGSGELADVDVRILVDGKRRLSESGVRRGRLLGPIRLDVTRANRIELIVDFGANGDLQDRFNWIEAALIK